MVSGCQFFDRSLIIDYCSAMKKERKGKQVQQEIKDKRNKRSCQKDEGCAKEQAFQQIENYKIFLDKLIGEGAYGRVYKAIDDDTGELLACKKISKKKLQNMKMYRQDYAEQLQKRFKTQSEFHMKLSGYPHIVKLIDNIQNKQSYYFFMEHCETDLSKVIKEQGTLGEEQAVKYFSQMVQGYKSIYQNNAFHRDLKPQNLLIKDNSIKITDFGFVKIFSEMDMEKECRSGKNKLRTESKVGSIKYMSPDVLSLVGDSESGISSTYNAQKSDIWSMGIILYKMLYGREPYIGRDEQQMIKTISQKELVFPDTASFSQTLVKNTQVSSEVKKLLKKMIEKKEQSRISFKKLYTRVAQLNKERDGEGRDKSRREVEGEARNKKEELLIFYNKMMVQLYHDSVNYASLRQIGMESYYQVTCKLMTLIHLKRDSYLQKQKQDEEVTEKIQQQNSTYHNVFFSRIQQIAKLQEQQTIQSVLLAIYPKIKAYQDYQMLMNQVLIFLINLMLLLSLQLKICEGSFVYIESLHLEGRKKDVILKHWLSTLKNIQRKVKGEIYQIEEHIRKERRHKEKKREKESKEKGEDGDRQQRKREKKSREHKKSRQKSHDRHKSRERKDR